MKLMNMWKKLGIVLAFFASGCDDNSKGKHEEAQQMLLDYVTLSFTGDVWTERSEFLQHLVKENRTFSGDLSEHEFINKLDTTLNSASVMVRFSTYSEKVFADRSEWIEHQHEIVINGDNMSEFDLLFRLQQKVTTLIKDQDKKYFEGLYFMEYKGDTAVYDMFLGS